MKILQVIPNLLSGGAERFTVDLCNELFLRGNEVYLLTFYDRNINDIFYQNLENGIRVLSLTKKSGFDIRLIQRLYKFIKLYKPDIIHSHLRALNYLMLISPFFPSIPLIHTIHSDAFMECDNSKLRLMRKFLFLRNNVIPVTISGESARSFSSAYPGIKNVMIFNGRSYPKVSSLFDSVCKELATYKQGDTKVIINIGRISYEKNQNLLVRAFNKLIVNDGVNAILLIIGSSRDSVESKQVEKSLRQLVSKSNNVYMLGEKVNATDYLYESDYFCLSSVYEGMPISLIESFAIGNIPICMPVGGIPEMINDLDTNLLPKSKSEEEFYNALKRAYFLSEIEKKALKQKAKDLFIEKYSIKTCATSYLSLYHKLIIN